MKALCCLELVYNKNSFNLTEIFVLRLFIMATNQTACSMLETMSVVKVLVSNNHIENHREFNEECTMSTENCVSVKNVYKWKTLFKEGQTTIARTGVNFINVLIMAKRKVAMEEISEQRLVKKLDGNYTRMLRAILNRSWRQHPTKYQLYGHLLPITKTIQVRRNRHAAHYWRSREELISDVLPWIPTYGRAKAGRPARIYIKQLCEDTRCSPEDLPGAMNDREKWREKVRDIRASGTRWWWWWWWHTKLCMMSLTILKSVVIEFNKQHRVGFEIDSPISFPWACFFSCMCNEFIFLSFHFDQC